MAKFTKKQEEKTIPKILAYIRVSTDKQKSENQRSEINKYAVNNKLIIDDFIDFEISSKRSRKDRGIDDLINQLNSKDTLIVSELSRLGRSTIEVLSIIDELIKKGITIIFIRQGLTLSNDSADSMAKVTITLFSLFAELERDLISQRTKEALDSRKKQGVILGRKKDSLSKSKYDTKANEILKLLNLKIPATTIIKMLGFGSPKTIIEWKNKRIEDNKLLQEFCFNDKYKKFLLECNSTN